MNTSKQTKTPIPITYVALRNPFSNCAVMISQNDAFNSVFPSNREQMLKCQGERYGHFDLSPTACTGASTVVAPVGGTTIVFDPGDGRNAMNITLPPYTHLKGMENAFSFSGIPYDPKRVESIMIGLGHIEFRAGIGRVVTQGEELGTLAFVPQSRIQAGILGVGIFVKYGGRELYFSPDLFEHPTWETNPASPYDMAPTPRDYMPGCPLLSGQ